MALLCHCYPTSDRRVAELAAEGAETVDEIGEACGAGTGCGGCHEAIAAVLCSVRVHVRVEQAA